MISTARWLVMCARGVFAVQRYFVMTMFSHAVGAEEAARSSCPPGREPTIRTSVSIIVREHQVVAHRPVRHVQLLPSGASPGSWRSNGPIRLAAHAEDGVGVEVLVALDEHVGDQRLVAVGGDHEVDVRRAHRPAPAGLQQLPDRAVGRDRIRLGLDRPEPEAARPRR